MTVAVKGKASLKPRPIGKTNDVDIAIRVGDEAEYDALKAALIGTGDFSAHDTEAIKLYYRQAIIERFAAIRLANSSRPVSGKFT